MADKVCRTRCGGEGVGEMVWCRSCGDGLRSCMTTRILFRGCKAGPGD